MVPEFRDPNLREIVFRSYRIIYRLNDARDQVVVISVMHGSRDLNNASNQPWESD